MQHRLLTLLVASLSCATALLTQEPAASRSHAVSFARAIPVHTAADDEGVAYGIWAAGNRYKVSFHDGMTFVPLLGRDYPTTQSLRWRTTSVRLGGHELLDAVRGGDVAAPITSDWRCEYRFGALTEAYDVLAGGLEQTFVLHERPADGDLVIRGAVTTGLCADEVEPVCRSLTFRDAEGRELIAYGRATAIDAVGRRCDVATGFAGGAITLTVPGEWLAEAVLPVVVDPLLSGTIATFSQVDIGSVDVGRDDVATTANVAFVYDVAVSAVDSDLYVELTDDGLTNPNVVYSDITSNWSTDQGRCAFVGGTGSWVFAFRRYLRNSTPKLSRIRVHRHDSGDTSLLTGIAGLPFATNENHWRPDVGGIQSYQSGTEALIVYQVENNGGGDFANAAASRVAAVRFDTTSALGSFAAAAVVASGTFVDCERPSVNQVAEGGAASGWVCAYQAFGNLFVNTPWNVLVRRIDASGTVAPGAWSSDYASSPTPVQQLGPIVEGNDGRYAVAFSVADGAANPGKLTDTLGTGTVVERFDWPAGGAPTTVESPHGLHGVVFRFLEATGLAYDTETRSHWVAVTRGARLGALYCDRVGFHGEVVDSDTIVQSGSHPSECGAVFDNDHDTVLCGYAIYNSANASVRGSLYSYSPAPPLTSYGVGCGTGSVGWGGSRQIGAEFDQVTVSGAPANSLHIMVLAAAGVDVPLILPGVVAPGCNLYVPFAGAGFLGLFPTALGSTAAWPLPLTESLPQQQLFLQDWYLDLNDLLLYSTPRLEAWIVK